MTPEILEARAAVRRLEGAVRAAQAQLSDEERREIAENCVRLRKSFGMDPRLVVQFGQLGNVVPLRAPGRDAERVARDLLTIPGGTSPEGAA